MGMLFDHLSLPRLTTDMERKPSLTRLSGKKNPDTFGIGSLLIALPRGKDTHFYYS